ncbi:hypothetical protein MUK42_34242 [Musa troglodytarum]|uniref:Uncharacterized protein n=1 Tax=Musa troglodytarum TaxID=320322 RepID=A0A9E7GCI3_9LILI|nr:hypothetical protein MUK42_34242 [Musa troglodytarum]
MLRRCCRRLWSRQTLLAHNVGTAGEAVGESRTHLTDPTPPISNGDDRSFLPLFFLSSPPPTSREKFLQGSFFFFFSYSSRIDSSWVPVRGPSTSFYMKFSGL